ncbi:MAG: hypothetical protein JST83_01350 [Bacteroidetes bacterium]|nr:hypothetical protein [Bacteroidota bacterium]
MKLTARIISLSAAVLLLASCNSHPAAKTEAATTASDPAAAPAAAPSPVITDTTISKAEHNKLNDIALYLAGMKPDSSVAIPQKLQNLAYYKLYSDSMNRGFNHIEDIRLSKMRDWAKTELADEQANPKTVFYPFSGPDILHCVQFFPDADQYIMIALEKYGSLPVMETMDSTKTIATLNSVQKSLEDIFGKSYFITHKMLRDVSNRWNGVTPVACVFLVRAGYTVLDVKYKHLLDDGKTMTEIPTDSMSKYINACVEIYFQKKGASKIQKIVYFKTNLCDDPYGGMASFKSNTALQTWLNDMPECYTYVKSASYLMNYGTFETIRNICLKKSKSILQDDTGIALRYLDKSKWSTKFYGNYVKPVSDFSGVDQKELYEVYKKDSANIKPLPFSLGYHWANKNTQNLMKFTRK